MVFDLRALLRNVELKHRTGLDQEVYNHVRDTPGAERLAFNAVVIARSLGEDTGADVTIAWGCTRGRHRSVGLARLSHELLLAAGDEATASTRPCLGESSTANPHHTRWPPVLVTRAACSDRTRPTWR
ncbi:RNase adapter RapZ [Streptomyces sp. NPDC048251]|uniref:RapZ C-terminal domain-containing protein n=1 Tax=Streptomyces sp. NPDC048251 TaxID=3154501 RepID=UPI00343BEE33